MVMPLALTSVSLAFAPHAAPIAPVAAPSWAMRAPTPELVVLPDPERSRTAMRWKMYEAAPATPAKRSRASKVRIGAATAIATAAGIRALPGIGRFYSAASIAAPLSCAVTTAAVKGVASDLFAQIVIERKLNMRDISYSRTFAFASFGAVYLGALASWKYNFLYTALFGQSTALSVILSKVSLDIFISGPLIYFPLYFIVKGLFAGQGPLKSLREYTSSKGMSILRRYWMLWLPVEMCMWSFVPAHLRIAFMCTVSLVWQVFLSTRTYCNEEEGCTLAYEEEEEDGCVLPGSLSVYEQHDPIGSVTYWQCEVKRTMVPVMRSKAEEQALIRSSQ